MTLRKCVGSSGSKKLSVFKSVSMYAKMSVEGKFFLYVLFQDLNSLVIFVEVSDTTRMFDINIFYEKQVFVISFIKINYENMKYC